jgi:hypothetical protein
MVGTTCTALRTDGHPCRATPLREEAYCFFHSPETAEEAADARRLGGLHRRKKKSVAAVYGFNGLRTIGDNLTLLETLVIETMALDNSIARNRAAAGMSATALKFIELGDLAERVAALEGAGRRATAAETDPFDD